ncbi:16S rRNA (guanine(966)-N(2))-methyltransferase RsmD [Acetobacteraceae bacterium KSS8]|uniref:16S rRNA (Guanine(966)-N(2))-methyltransferase RsmD n=1 Tax=Endosaccharibacter trunci TaxID=2812733 RepID=A0ABT1W3F3_9PROT|nr:16S rRNA (guanine(966)-N(2))-methyltransferase RsmD [Acetobacteraceae bacterium KSS8]
MRIVAGSLRGRGLIAPSRATTRPTADRVRQALFDMLAHAGWAGDALQGTVLDAFSGTGALGLEALSRGAARAVFVDRDRHALSCTRANIAACGMEARALVVAADATRPPPAKAGWDEAGLVFLDPPYHGDLVAPALAALLRKGWVRADALIVAEIAADEALPTDTALLAERAHGAARLCCWRLAQD